MSSGKERSLAITRRNKQKCFVLAQCTCMPQDSGILLKDFASAYPSVNHNSIHHVLRSAVLPALKQQFLRMIHDDNITAVEYAGKTRGHFPMARGVREECPASGFLSQWRLVPYCDCYTVWSFRGTLPFLFVCSPYHLPTPMILMSRHLHFVL